jgi:thiamine thiazole synthase
MIPLDEVAISKTILKTYSDKLLDRVQSDVLIVGGGPAGLVAAHLLAGSGLKVTVMEKRLSPGGGIWGGGMGMNVAVVQDEAAELLEQFGIGFEPQQDGLHAVDSVELAAGLCCKAIQAGAALLNLITVEDLCLAEGRVNGAVINQTGIYGVLPVDPLVFHARAVVDATGHDAALVQMLRKRGLLEGIDIPSAVEGPMNATEGEAFVVERACQFYPGLWISGMSVSATLGGPRMGPIFGGMLLSGKRIAELIAAELAEGVQV